MSRDYSKFQKAFVKDKLSALVFDILSNNFRWDEDWPIAYFTQVFVRSQIRDLHKFAWIDFVDIHNEVIIQREKLLSFK